MEKAASASRSQPSADPLRCEAPGTSALDQAGCKLVASGLTYCLNNPEQAAEQGYDIDDVQKMFMKLA